MSHPFGEDTDERAITSPRLLEMIEAVRSDSLRDTDVTLPVIRREIAAKGKGFRAGVAAGVILAAAAAVTLWVMHPGPGPSGSAPVLAVEGDAEPSGAGGVPAPTVPFSQEFRISDAIRVTWKGGTPPRALGAWELELGEGSYEVGLTEPRPERLTIRVDGRRLELSHGELMVATQGEVPVVTLVSGVAAWVAPDGTRTPLEIETVTAQRADRSIEIGAPVRESAIELAREAEELLGVGERRAAIVVLRKLVLRHPKSAAARSALLDLGRELSNEGMRDHARCAYQAYLERFPDGQMRVDVERSLERLGTGAACDGLDPR